MSLFEKGRAKTGGRVPGVRNKVGQAFLEALSKDFDEHGEAAIKIMRVEQPAAYCKMLASILPQEFEITETKLQSIPDAELDILLSYARRRITDYLGSGEGAEANGREVELLPPVSQAN
jgi:hypothetical protein